MGTGLESQPTGYHFLTLPLMGTQLGGTESPGSPTGPRPFSPAWDSAIGPQCHFPPKAQLPSVLWLAGDNVTECQDWDQVGAAH